MFRIDKFIEIGGGLEVTGIWLEGKMKSKRLTVVKFLIRVIKSFGNSDICTIL